MVEMTVNESRCVGEEFGEFCLGMTANAIEV